MTTVAMLLKWEADPLDQLVSGLIVHGRHLGDLQDELDVAGTLPDWVGSDADAARGNQELLRRELCDLVAEVAACAHGVSQAVASVRGARRVLEDALLLASRHGFHVDHHSGEVYDVEVASDDEHERRDRARLHSEIRDHIAQALRTADLTDLELTLLLDQLVRGTVDGDDQRLQDVATKAWDTATRPIHLPPPDASLDDYFAWWQGLGGDEQQRIINEHPDLIRNVDGIPSWARDMANRVRLPELKAELLAALIARLRRPGRHLDFWQVRLLREKLAGLDKISAALDRPGKRQLLALDASDDELKTVIALGDVDAADNVTVLTLGFTTTVESSLLDADDKVTDLLSHAEDLDPTSSHATVIWMGYEAPQVDDTLHAPFGQHSVLTDDLAQEGAEDLADFLNGVDASRGEDPHLTNAGHSYGGHTAALATMHSTGTDELVVLGVPSIGTDDVSELDVPDGHIHSLEADNDLVGDVGLFGPDVTYLDGVHHLDTAAHDGLGLSEVTGHTSYFTDGSTSQHNLAAVGAGLHDQLVDDTRGPELTDEIRHTVQQGQDLLDDGIELLEGAGEKVRDGLSALGGLIGR